MDWKEKYRLVAQSIREEKIYDKYKGETRSETPKKGEVRDICFNPFIEYEIQNKFPQLNINNIFRLSKLVVFNPEWFIFFISIRSKEDFPTNESIKYQKVNDAMGKKMGILFFLIFFVFSFIPIILCFIYSQIGILKLISPSQQLTVFHFVLLENTVTPLIFSDELMNYYLGSFNEFPNILICKNNFLKDNNLI